MGAEKMCFVEACGLPARLAVRTFRSTSTRANLYTTVWWDEREAPATALPYCKAHGIVLLADLAKVLIDEG